MTKAFKMMGGVLLRPLAVGSSALFLHNAQVVRTSRVVAVYGCTEDGVRFETLNTNYYLLTGPTYEPAAGNQTMALAA